MKSGSTGINENIIFEGMMDSTEFLIDFFSTLMTCTTCTIAQLIIIRGFQAGFLVANRSTHILKEDFGGMGRATSRKMTFILVEMAHKEPVRYFSARPILKTSVLLNLPALVLQTDSSEDSVISTVPFCPVMFTASYCHAGAPGAAVKQLWIHFTLCKSLFPHLSGLPEPEDTKLSVGSLIHCMNKIV